MKPQFSPRLMTDLTDTLHGAIADYGIVNVPVLAEEIRRRNEADNIALEDIAEHLLNRAQALSVAMVFDRPEIPEEAA